MNAGRRLMVLILVSCVAAAGCTTERSEPPATSAGPPPPAPGHEDQADWAVSALDPCALAARFSGLPGSGKELAPRTCTGTLPSGQSFTIEVGYTFTHDNRRRAIPEAHAGLLGYRTFLSGGGTMPSCQIVIPLSFTRAVQISVSPDKARTVEQQCDAAGRGAPAVAELMRDKPAAAQRSDPPTSPARWAMCTLRDTALGPPATQPRYAKSSPDACRTDPSDGPEFELWVHTGADPVTALANEPGAQRITVDADRTALQLSSQVCALTWAQERLADGRFHVLNLRGMRGRCPTAEQARKLVSTLASAPPPTPARLGFSPDQPDESVDPVCRIVAGIPTECRPRREIAVPTGTDAIMRAGAGDQGSDIACAMLAPAIEAVTGQPPVIAHTKEKCVGAPPDRSLTFTLALTDFPPQHAYTNPPPPITVAGYPAINGGNDTSFRALDISPYRDLNRAGDVRLLGSLELPLGSLQTGSPNDPARLAVVDRIAEFLLRTYFR